MSSLIRYFPESLRRLRWTEELKKGWEQLEEGLTKAMGRLSDAIKES